MIGDLAGFAAAVVRRGLDYVQVPTTLLAQVDSSVGGKTAIDSPHGKNLVGAFHQPVLVVADTALLDTLPPREFRAGYAEVAKYGLIGDAAFFAWLEANWQDVFAGGPAREHAIATSCRAKAAIVARDERETGERALLNLGHTFGHALEAAAGFSDRLLHGEAIALGMALRVRVLGAARAAADGRRPSARSRHLAAVGLPTRLSRGARRRARCRPADGPDRPGQEGQARQADLHPGARHRRAPSSRPTSTPPRCAPSWPRSSPSDDDSKTGLHSPSSCVCLVLLVLLFRERDGADRGLARAHAAAGEGRQPRAPASSTGCSRSRERMIGAILTGNNVVNIAASALDDRPAARLVRRRRRALRHRDHDRRGRGVRRGAAEDRRDQRARPGRAAGGAADLLDGAAVRADADRRSRRWCAGSCGCSASRSAPTRRSCRRTRSCAARSTCCTTRAASRSTTATCSAACSTCAISSSPT